MQKHKFFPTDWYAECILVFLRWLVRALGLKCPRMGLLFPPSLTSMIRVGQSVNPVDL